MSCNSSRLRMAECLDAEFRAALFRFWNKTRQFVAASRIPATNVSAHWLEFFRGSQSCDECPSYLPSFRSPYLPSLKELNPGNRSPTLRNLFPASLPLIALVADCFYEIQVSPFASSTSERNPPHRC